MEFNIGDLVTISTDAVYYTGSHISPLIKAQTWVVSSISGDRVVLGKSADGYYNLNAPVAAKYLNKTSS